MKKMKKTILVLIAITAFLGSINAQSGYIDNRESLIFGLKAGINYANVYDTEGEDFRADPKIGLATGVFLSIPIGTFLGIQPEVLYSRKGFRATGKILGGSYDFTRTTDFIDVPILFALKPTGIFTILAGPQYSYLLKRKDVFANGVTTIEQEMEFENEDLRKNTLCFLGGVDVNLNHLVLSGRVGWDILNNNGDGSTTTPRYKNVWYQFTVGYRMF